MEPGISRKDLPGPPTPHVDQAVGGAWTAAPGPTLSMTIALLLEIAQDVLDASQALRQSNPLAALDSLGHVERRVGEARQFVRRQIKQDAPRGANVVVMHGRRSTRL